VRKADRFRVFGRSFAEPMTAGTAKSHFLRHGQAALGTKLFGRAAGAEILLRLHMKKPLR
jgi:hypothetical protein